MRTHEADDLMLEPQTVAHAADLFPLLRDPALHRCLDTGPPPGSPRASPNWKPAGSLLVGFG